MPESHTISYVAWKDPIVEETRALREAYAQQFAYDAKVIFRDNLRQLAESGRPFFERRLNLRHPGACICETAHAYGTGEV